MSRAPVRVLLRVLARLAVVPFAGLVLFVVAGGLPSWSGVAYVAGGAALLLGLATLPDADPGAGAFASSGPRASRGRPRGVSRGAAAFLLLAAAGHVVLAGSGAILRFETTAPASILAAVVDESDLAEGGARALFALRVEGLTDDVDTAPRAIRDAYARLRTAHGDLPSPVVATAALGANPTTPDLVVLAPSRERPAVGVVFLHGYAGSFVLPCATVAQAFTEVTPSVAVACPSLGLEGAWWTEAGGRALRSALARVRAEGASTIFLVGLSNGGIGLSRLLPRLRGELPDVAGAIFVSGVDAEAAAPSVPALVVHGRRDRMTSFGAATAYASRHGARLAPLEAGHFAMLVDEARFRREVTTFVRAHVPRRVAAASPSASP